MKPIAVFFLLFFSSFICNSQNETSKWHFGQFGGLDFMTTPPTAITSSVSPFEGSASIADAAGNTLFYTDGITIYNQQNTVMANGTGLSGGVSSTQAAIIVKQPGSTNMYYVFTMGDFGGALCYSTLDMLLAAGQGSVTVKNATLYAPCTEKLTAVKHCNGVDVWIITHDYNSNNFRCYLLTSSGVNPVPVITPVGPSHTGAYSYAGCIKASPNGKKLGLATMGINYFEIYDFDPTSGIVSNPLNLLNILWPYGCEFSPDGTKFYGCQEGVTNAIYQWNLCAGSNSAIVASKYIIATLQGVGLYGMQLALDGKIYVGRASQALGMINAPDIAGAGCNYVNAGPSIAPAYCGLGLPNFVSSYFDPPPASFLTETVTCGATVSFSAEPAAATNMANCNASAYSGATVIWNFGDPGSGTANNSTLSNPTHSYSGAGTYTVQLIRTYPCRTDTFVQVVTVTNLPAPAFSLSGNFNICNHEATVLSATGQGVLTYTWNPVNSTGVSITVSPTVSTVYSVTAKDPNNCLTTHTVQVIVNACTDLIEQSVTATAKIYPNPTDGKFMIVTELQKFDYTIYNHLGLPVDHASVKNANTEVDLQDLPKGIYFMELRDGRNRQRLKLVKTD